MALTTQGKRGVLTVRVRRPDASPVAYRFNFTRYEKFQVFVGAGATVLQQLDSEAPTNGSPEASLIVLRSSVETVQWWEVNAAVPSVASTAVLPKRELNPYEVVRGHWTDPALPAVVFYNPSADDARVEVTYARA